jgi:hypothetical protein
LLCFGPSRGQSVTFVRPEKWLGWWETIDRQHAMAEMGRRYLRGFGPATRRDFARWWGVWSGVGNAAWSAMKDELVSVSVEGTRLDALASDVEAMRHASIEEPVQLLPGFDAYLMGYASRDHMVERKFASRVSRTAGWISAVVLVNGSVAGTWTHIVANKALRLTVVPFRRFTPAVKAAIRERAGILARALGAEKVDVKFG